MRPAVLALSLLLLAGQTVSAQDAPLVLRLPASARALALGGILPPGSPDAAAIFYHSAFARETSGISGGAQWLGADTVAFEVAGVVEWLGGSVGLGLRTASYTGPFRSAVPLPAGDLMLPQPVSERTAQVTYGRTLMGIRLALSGKYVDQRWNDDRGARWAVDASAGTSAGPIRLAVTAQNFGPDLDVGGVTVPLDRRVLLAAAPPGGAPLGPLDVLPTVQVAWERGERFTPAAGVELGYWPVGGRTFFLRGGVRRPDPGERAFALGAGFAGDRIALDYAILPLTGGRASHRIGVRWR